MATQYGVKAYSADVFGRVICSARNHHFVVDGPVQNGCPGEAITPAELFLGAVACCGVELVQVIAEEQHMAIKKVGVTVDGETGRKHPVQSDFTVFNRVALSFTLHGVTDAQAVELIEAFKGR